MYFKIKLQMFLECFQLEEIRKQVSFNWVTWAFNISVITWMEICMSNGIMALYLKCSSIFWRIYTEQTWKWIWKCLLAYFIKLFIIFLFLHSLKKMRASQAASELNPSLLKMLISDARSPTSMQRSIFPRTSMRAVSKENVRSPWDAECVLHVSEKQRRSKNETVSVNWYQGP